MRTPYGTVAPTPTMDRERAYPAGGSPTPPAENKIDSSMSTFMTEGLDRVIDRFGRSIGNISCHCDQLMGNIPQTASDAKSPEPNTMFGVLEAKLRILQAQAEWLEAVAQRVYRI